VEDSSRSSSSLLLAVVKKILPYGTTAPNLVKILAGAGFPKKGQMPDLPEPKSGTSLVSSMCTGKSVHNYDECPVTK